MNPKILVIDDDQMITSSLKRVLTYEGFHVEVANNGREGLACFESIKPDLLILDVIMPDISGINLCQNIKKRASTPVLFLSARDEVSDRVVGLENGGDDYLVKPFAFEELIARIRVLLRRNNLQTPKTELLQFEDLVLDAKSKTVTRNGGSIELSATEYQLLLYLMSNPRRVLSKDAILDWVWGYDFGGDTNIVEVYIFYLRMKLEREGGSRLIHTVRGMGYILDHRRKGQDTPERDKTKP
jgi:Response regulators consisting of a CheY-like receiver domain and a winged-helix DNA-binding domain